MNEFDYSFEQSPWEAFLRTKQMGDTVSAANTHEIILDRFQNTLLIWCKLISTSRL